MKPTLGIASYSFHSLYGIGAMSIFQYFEAVRYRYGLHTADIWNGMLLSYDDTYLKLVRAMMDEHDLTLVNLCCDQSHLWSDDEEEMAACDAQAQACLHAAEVLGARSVRFDVGIRSETATDAQIAFCAQKYDRYCAQAARFGARLGPENHWGASKNPVELRKLLQAVKADNFGILLHLGNWQQNETDDGESKAAYDREFAGHAMHLHIPYEVCMEAEKRLALILEDGYQGCWSVECMRASDEYNHVNNQLAHVRSAIFRCAY